MAVDPKYPAGHSGIVGAERTRQRLLNTALRLFGLHSFAGTSLQMIADELGVTKAAVYYHFRTREELLTAVVQPAFAEMRVALAEAEARRGTHARAEHLLMRYVDLAVRYRGLLALVGTDPAVGHLLQAQEGFADLVERQVRLLAAAHPDPQVGTINASVALSGITIAASGPLLSTVDEEDLRHHLLDVGRRILGLRSPRSPSPGRHPLSD